MFLDEIISQIEMVYSLGVIHADLGEYNIFVYGCGVQFIDWPQYVNSIFKRKYGIERDVDDVVASIKQGILTVG